MDKDQTNPQSAPVADARHISPGILIPMWILAIVAAGFVLHEASVIFLWLICSFLLFAFVDPWMQRLNRHGISPVISAIVLVTLVTMTVFGIGVLIYSAAPSMAEEFESYRKTLLHLYQSVNQDLTHWLKAISRTPVEPGMPALPAPAPVAAPPSSLATSFAERMLHGLGSAVTGLTFAVLCPILTIFLIAERERFETVFTEGFFGRSRGQQVWSRITAATGGFFLGNFILLAISFPVFWILFMLFGVQSALTMAIVSSFMNLIPFVGAILTGLFPSLSLIVHDGSGGAVLGLYGACILVHFTVANVITPKIVGSKLDLNATASTIALIAWGELWGGLGLILAIPITAVIKILMEHSGNERLYWIAMLMSEDPKSLLQQGYRRVDVRRLVKKRASAAQSAGVVSDRSLTQGPEGETPLPRQT